MLTFFYLWAIATGAMNFRYWEAHETTWYDPLLQIASAIGLGWWAVVDARRRGHPLPMLSKPWLFLFAGVAVPGYVIWSRGWKGIVWLVVHMVAWVSIALVSMVAFGFAMYGLVWFQGMGR